MPFVTTADETALSYNDWGSGPAVVLVHGWPLQSDMWEYQSVFPAAHGLRVITYDRRGFGHSSRPYTGYDYDTMSEDLRTVLETLDVTGATLVGFSMGGGEVARYIARHGAARVSKAVLASAVTPFLVKTEDNANGVDRSTFDQMIAGLTDGRRHFLGNFGKMFFGAGMLNFTVTTEIMQWALGMALQALPKATLDCVRAFSETDFRADLRAFDLPTLIIHGDADSTVPIENSADLTASLVAGSQPITYPGAPHGLFFTARDKLNHDLLTFVTGRDRGPAG
jgi:pimeloyl-ACP methyl ester carboxylesterase